MAVTVGLGDLNGISSDLSSVLGSEKLADSQNSDRLRDFYKKLIQTDAQIKRLKESLAHNYQTETDIKSISERFKRSMEDTVDFNNELNADSNKVHNNNDQYKNAIVYNAKELNKRGKRDNNTKLTGFVVQKEKYYVQYEPIVQRRNFPKCYHGHNGKYHEKKLKHPFYKNSQRLDEMLYQSDDGKTTIKDKANYKTTRKPQEDPRYRIKNNDYVEKDEDYNDVLDTLNFTIAKNFSDMSPDYFENKQVNIPQSTIESIFTQTKTPKDPNEKKFEFGRKLMQVNEEDEEALRYDDLKEVLADDQDTHDETDKQVERIKRNNDDNTPTNFMKTNPSPGIYNPNWKGPMPLYPDEINAMIKQAALHNLNIQVPVDTKDIKIEKDKAERDITDTEYVEDYLDDKYNKLVNMAQAYSDYGVLDAKQDMNSATTKGTEKPEEGMKVFSDVRNGRMKKGGIQYDPEGVRIEYKPGTVSQKNDIKCLLNSIRKHIRFVKPHKVVCPVTPHTRSTAADKVYTPAQTTDNVKTPNKEANKVIFTLKKPLRSLKSIDDEKKEVVKANDTNGFGEFLAMMADFFFSMANEPREIKGNATNFNVSKESTNIVNKSEILYPMYDSEMIENIGHRSRVLMSIDDNITATEENNKTNVALHNGTVANTTLTSVNGTNNTTSDNKTHENNKTVVKRSIGSNFIFWNDLYDDDEYGMKVDYLDNILRGKHAAKYNYKGALLKSKDWVQDKLKTMTDKIRDDINQKWKLVEDRKDQKKPNPNMLPHKIVNVRRMRSIDNNNGEDDVRKTFAILNANLKRVCKQAAEAVRNTRKIETRADNEEGTQATGLMQQLVRLMSDLVDIQVQQKTCAKLPPDLRDFLEWLTAPPENNPIVDNLPSLSEYSHMFPDGRFEKSTDLYDLPTLTEDTHQDDRTECLGSIRAVQDLIQQYDGMTDEDKSKMAGVREYLENQLEFLNRKLNSLNEYDTFNYKKREVRNKRSLKKPRFRRLLNKYLFYKTPDPTTTLKANTKTKHKHNKTKKHKKKYKKGKKEELIAKGPQKVKTEHEKLEEELKHLNNIDIVTKENVNKGFAEYNNDLNSQEDNINNGVYFNDKLDAIDTKVRNERNLRDVYFRALDEAKKTTVKKND
ncbi:uncharacterized protein LOC123703964 [Colias croceus]|uniref:uncharacterized protein LOC123703964 n=1 Tax=Colias crocea TaxID=72248 RepID=UPI001E27B9CE|nr:uncharacterized protein LOC123703964 [Colias croceus]